MHTLSRLLRAPVLLLVACGWHVAHAQTAIVIGGNLRYDNDAVWQRIVQEAGGPGKARFAVLATASAVPEQSANAIVQVLQRHGAQAEHIPVAPRLEGADLQKNLNDPALIAKVRASNAVFFSGGAQGLIVDTFQPDGKNTPMLDAIWDVYRRGGVVAGTSAGAAIMSRTMFRDALDVMGVMRGQMREGHEIDRGLGFVSDRLFVDQHFLKRGRIGRMLPLMMAQGYRLGLGIEENSAAVIQGQQVDIIGARGALLVDLRTARTDPALGAFNVQDARLSYLDNGDHYDLRTGQATPEKRKTPVPEARLIRATHAMPGPVNTFQTDILGDNRIVQAMAELITAPTGEVRAMAARVRPGATEARDRTAFVFRLYRGAGTQGWFNSQGDADDVTLLDVRLDVRPVPVPLAAPPRLANNTTPAGQEPPGANEAGPIPR
ncbi:cyanophycinase [Roseateles sp. YR242]|uniref:cyanophycinase n=1 Tax=Roseateles sp. YR242 TaxID=1855305 RepID=UPI0008D397F7|nr:cyanophycinase [Roseateles sp. YR242]SEK28081.1 cyanophycinase [Roseateles sp. YR242]